MKILALSTSTARGSAAVLDDGTALATIAYADIKGHAERIFGALDDALAEARLGRGDIEALACDVGPGSFTGVRVGVASVKGIALALDLPCVGVCSLEAMAAAAFADGAAGEGDVVVAAIDAKKGEVFLAAYACGPSGELTPVLEPCHREATRGALVLPGESRRMVVVGEIAAALLGEPNAAAPVAPAGIARGPSLDLPDALWIARLAVARFVDSAATDPAALEALYVRAPDAKPQTAISPPATPA
jgi:tRNA threonylcarbamoyladenosine biosynthesis protein TsaB